MYAEMRVAGLTGPAYVQTAGSVRLVLSSAPALPDGVRESLSPGARKALDALRSVRRPVSTGEVVDILGVARPTAIRYLTALREVGLVVWEGQSARDPRATWRVS